MKKDNVIFLTPSTCGIYKNGGVRYKIDPSTGKRTTTVDNQLNEAVEAYLSGKKSEYINKIPLNNVKKSKVIVPTYYDKRYYKEMKRFLELHNLKGIKIKKLLDENLITVRGGHGSPSNDVRNGTIPYIKVSDIRGLRINTNPTNLVPESVARSFWGGNTESGLKAWDLITPNRASSNIGEFAILLPGEERLVITKEVFIFRTKSRGPWDPFYLLWALSLTQVRDQWRRIALMQTNREDCGERYKEIILPDPKSAKWAKEASKNIREYFTTISEARNKFIQGINKSKYSYIASVTAVIPSEEDSIKSAIGSRHGGGHAPAGWLPAHAGGRAGE